MKYSHGRHDIPNQINALPPRPPTDEHEKVCVGILRNVCPFLSPLLESRSFRLRILVDRHILCENEERMEWGGTGSRYFDVTTGVREPSQGLHPELTRCRRAVADMWKTDSKTDGLCPIRRGPLKNVSVGVGEELGRESDNIYSIYTSHAVYRSHNLQYPTVYHGN